MIRRPSTRPWRRRDRSFPLSKQSPLPFPAFGRRTAEGPDARRIPEQRASRSSSRSSTSSRRRSKRCAWASRRRPRQPRLPLRPAPRARRPDAAASVRPRSGRRERLREEGRLDRRIRRDYLPGLLVLAPGRGAVESHGHDRPRSRRPLLRLQVRRPLRLQLRGRVRARRHRIRQGGRGRGRVRVRRLAERLARVSRARGPPPHPDGLPQPAARAAHVPRRAPQRRRDAHPPVDVARDRSRRVRRGRPVLVPPLPRERPRTPRATPPTGIREGRQEGSLAMAHDFALTGRLDFIGVNGVLVGASFFTGCSGQGRTTASGETVCGRTTVWDLHADFRWRGALPARARRAARRSPTPAAINELNGLSGDEGVGSRQSGWYAEAGFDVLTLVPRTKLSLTPFMRYEEWDTQAAVPDGFSGDPGERREPVDRGRRLQAHPAGRAQARRPMAAERGEDGRQPGQRRVGVRVLRRKRERREPKICLERKRGSGSAPRRCAAVSRTRRCRRFSSLHS